MSRARLVPVRPSVSSPLVWSVVLLSVAVSPVASAQESEAPVERQQPLPEQREPTRGAGSDPHESPDGDEDPESSIPGPNESDSEQEVDGKPGPESPAPGQPEVQPPSIRAQAEAELPAGIIARDARVLLEIVIDEQGHVEEASVLESEAPELSEAARRAVLRSRFEPARVQGQPVKVRIRYEYSFAAPPERDPQRVEVEGEPSPEPKARPKTAETQQALHFGARASIEAPPREPTRHRLDTEQLSIIPGTRGDALKAVEVMPGVARTALGDNVGAPILRGSKSSDSTVRLDGIPIPNLYHLGGLTSVFNSHLLESVTVYPSNFSSRYGQASGGVVEVQSRPPRADSIHGVVELSLLDNSVLVEGPLGSSTSAAVAARRSNIDLVFESLVPEDGFDVVAAPVYYDYQAVVRHQLEERHVLKTMAYGSYDRLELVFSDPDQEDPAFRDQVRGVYQFHRLHAALSSDLGSGWQHSLTLAGGHLDAQQRIGPLDSHLRGFEAFGRSDWEGELNSWAGIRFGVTTSWFDIDGEYVGPAPPQEEGDPTISHPLGTSRTIEIEDSLSLLRPGAYLELPLYPVAEWLLLPGLRADYYSDVDDATLDPRLATRYQLEPSTALKGGIGLYSQPPEYFQSLEDLGNPALEPYHALHISLGVERELTKVAKVGVEGFHKRLYNRVVSTEGSKPPRFINDGTGQVWGAEVQGEFRPSSRSFGYLAYTLSRSERQDRELDSRLFDYDQTHVLSVAASYELGAGWLFGARFRYVSGNPSTPITAAVYDATTDLYRPVFGATNSEREAAFHQLDLRIEKTWNLGDGSVAAYLELLNAYNAENVEGRRYSFDYTESETVTGLPFFPNLGVRGEL